MGAAAAQGCTPAQVVKEELRLRRVPKVGWCKKKEIKNGANPVLFKHCKSNCQFLPCVLWRRENEEEEEECTFDYNFVGPEAEEMWAAANEEDGAENDGMEA